MLVENNKETNVSKNSRIFLRSPSILEATAIVVGIAIGGGVAPIGFKIVGVTAGSLLGVLCIVVFRYWAGHTQVADQTEKLLPLPWKGNVLDFILLCVCLNFVLLALHVVIYRPDKRLVGVVTLILSVTFSAGYIYSWIEERNPQAPNSGFPIGYIIICFGLIIASFGLMALGSIYIGILGVITFGTFAIIGIIKMK